MLLTLSTLLVGGVLAIPTGPSTPTCVSISYAKFEGPACGVIIFQEMSDETVKVSTMGKGICGLDASSGSYPYHIHMNQIPSSGDCSAAGDHFDPYNVGDVVCDPNNPGSCQVGDCSGKHGEFEAPRGTCSYNDQYMSLDSGNKGYIGGKSVVIHQSDDTAFACANIIEVSTEEEIPVPDCSNVVPPTSATCDSTSPVTDVESPPPETSTSCDRFPTPPASTPITSPTTPTTPCDSSTLPPAQDNQTSPPSSTSDTTPCDTPTPTPTTPCDTSTTPPDQDNQASPPGPTSTTTPCDRPTPPPPTHTTDCDTSTSPPDQDNDIPPPTPTRTTPCDTPTPTPTTTCDTPTPPPEEINQPTPPDSSDSYSTDCDTSTRPTPPPAQFNPFPPLTVTTSESYTSSNSFTPQETDEGGHGQDFSPPSPTSSCTSTPIDDHEGNDPGSQPTGPQQQVVADQPVPTATSNRQYVPGSTGIPTGLVTLTTSSVVVDGPTATNAPLFTGGAEHVGIAKWTSLIIVGMGFFVML